MAAALHHPDSPSAAVLAAAASAAAAASIANTNGHQHNLGHSALHHPQLLHPGHLHQQMLHQDHSEFGGSPNARSSMGSSASSPNEHLYSSLYGREMELMRKMFKANEKIDPLDGGNGNFAGTLRSTSANGSNFGPYTSPIFGGNAAKYFEGLNPSEQSAKFGGGLRAEHFEHNVHNSNNTDLSPAIKSQAAVMGEKHFGMHFANNHNNNNVMNPNQNLSDPSSLSSTNSNNNNNIVLNNHKSYGGGFASANLNSPTPSENGPVSSSATNTTLHHNHGLLDSSALHFAGHNIHGGNFHLEKGLGSNNKMADFESTRKSVDDAKSMAKMGAKLDEHFLDDELKTRLGQQLAASLLNSPHHHQSPGSLQTNHGSNGNSNNNHNNHNLSNDDEDDDEFTNL